MSTAKHTPGPRDVTRERGHGFEHFVVSGARGRFVAQFSNEADARLDAAAPDLLAALKNLVAMQRSGMLIRSDHAAATGHDFLTQACDAIAKAEGES